MMMMMVVAVRSLRFFTEHHLTDLTTAVWIIETHPVHRTEPSSHQTPRIQPNCPANVTQTGHA